MRQSACLVINPITVDSFAISVLRSLDTEANKFYNRTSLLYDVALLTMCYTQHALRPVIGSKINHIRHFIKMPFINKGMDFIDLPSISEINRYNHPYQIISSLMKYQSFVINIINLLGVLYVISINLFLILISKLITLTPQTARTLNMFIRLQVMLLRAI